MVIATKVHFDMMTALESHFPGMHRISWIMSKQATVRKSVYIIFQNETSFTYFTACGSGSFTIEMDKKRH